MSKRIHSHAGDRINKRSDVGEVVFPIEKLMQFRKASTSCVHIEAALEADRNLISTPITRRK